MQNGFTSYIAGYDGSGKPALSEHTFPLHPSQPVSPTLPKGKTFLVSGFSSLIKDSPAPLSPTLQLNGDLGNFSSPQLAAIARAELKRLTQPGFRSFIREKNPKVVVIGKKSDDIARFIDTYGGVLEIDPLLVKGSNPAITTAEEISVRDERNGLCIDFLSRVPVDLSRCTYCGSCGPTCPEQCIDEHLFLDLGRCSFCGECVRICPQEAIDLYGVVKRTIRAPALLLLADMDAESIGTGDKIYREEEISRLFGSIYDCRIDETIVCDNTICQYIGRLDQGCDLCLRACTHRAIQKDEDGIHVDQERCMECGDCVALCPTGALQSLRFPDAGFIEYFQNISLEPGCTVVIGKEEVLHSFWWLNRGTIFNNTFFLEHPCVEALHSMHLLFLLALGAGRILLFGDRGENKGRGLHGQIRQVNTIVGDIFPDPPVLTADPNDAAIQLDGTVQFLRPDGYSNFSFTNRREKLASLLAYFIEQKEPADQFTGEVFSEFGAIRCDPQRCSSCLACVGECRIQSLVADSDEFALLQTPILCTQCGACIFLCPEQALTLRPGLTLSKDFFTPQLLVQADPMRCRKCGKVFGTRQSFERVMHVLKRKQPELNLELFSYCEDCRVLQMIEETEA
ncbi:MAG TPA: 4Fe-4S dicluster domain-containing protein [Desulfobulbus sp.]|nr:4Fe-4S dicluster domain-containing protein [Desulfobulbus sp.]